MATRSMIYVKMGDKYNGVYCHSDGYLEHNGVLLYVFYNTLKKASDLIGLGHLSVLGVRLGHKIDFNERMFNPNYYDKTKGQCVAYARDRDDDWEVVTYNNISEFQLESYNYVFDGEWFLVDGLQLVPLRNYITKTMLKNAKKYLDTFNMTQDEWSIYLDVVGKDLPKKDRPKITKADFIVLKQENDKFEVKATVNNSVVILTRAQLKALMTEKDTTIVRKWGNGFRQFKL